MMVPIMWVGRLQRNGVSIQGEIEDSLKKIFNQEIKLYVAGRTDAGVHALSQVAHFDIENYLLKLKNF